MKRTPADDAQLPNTISVSKGTEVFEVTNGNREWPHLNHDGYILPEDVEAPLQFAINVQRFDGYTFDYKGSLCFVYHDDISAAYVR